MRYLFFILVFFIGACSTVSFDCTKKADEMTDSELEYCAHLMWKRKFNTMILEEATVR